MKLVWLIARKYFFSKKNPSAINIITAISLSGYAIGALALIVLLSALNGFETAIFGGYKFGDADLKVVAKQGKVFQLSTQQLNQISLINGVKSKYQCLEDKAIVKFNDKQTVALVRGVDTGIYRTLQVDSLIVSGSKVLQKKLDQSHPAGITLYPPLSALTKPLDEEEITQNFAWLSEGMVYKLNIGSENSNLELLVPDRSSESVSQSVLNQEDVMVSAMMKLGEDLNESTLFVPIEVARSLFSRETEMSALHLKVIPQQLESVQNEVQKIVGQSFEVLNRREQHKTMYKMFNTEKWVSFALLAFILLLISFNLFGSIRMMTIDKQQDLKMLNALGMRVQNIRNVFILEGQMVSVVGTLLGLSIGAVLVILQQHFGWVKTQSTFAMAYPVELSTPDFFLIFALNIFLAFITSILAIRIKIYS